ncbi:MAG: hypothetical protein P3T54_03105 [Dehalogenimonas sp.]|jgi:amino acid permease|uniref:Uncharacterized protein n=1 Tax=Candidatus Dehalogenimonas loeffleri TaxID=3127115 RepID=A0ABZ2J1F7_9CHLR|nr:hypothetical protein [Dehalogenimonas sp.]
MWKIPVGIVSGIIGIVILINVVLETEYVAFAAENMALQMVVAIVGLAFIHLGYRLVTSRWSGK